VTKKLHINYDQKNSRTNAWIPNHTKNIHTYIRTYIIIQTSKKLQQNAVFFVAQVRRSVNRWWWQTVCQNWSRSL